MLTRTDAPGWIDRVAMVSACLCAVLAALVVWANPVHDWPLACGAVGLTGCVALATAWLSPRRS